MRDRRSFTLGQLVQSLGGELVGDAGVRVEQVSTLESAQATDICFVVQERYLAQLRQTHAAAVILGPQLREATTLPRIIAANPHAYFAKVAALLHPPAIPEPGIHATAVVAATARIAATAAVGPCVVIGEGALVAEHAVVGAGCFIGEGARVGAGTRLHANVTVLHQCMVGARCIVHSGAIIGSDGFGLAHEDGTWTKIPQIGRVLIGDDVEVGANTTIDRGALDDTVIEEGVKLDNQIQIAHNVRIGAHTAIAACVGIAGSAKIGRGCTLGGAAMIYGHITIADYTNISAGTLIMKSLSKAGTYTGVYPFEAHQRWLKNAAQLRQLSALSKRVSEIESYLAREKGGAHE